MEITITNNEIQFPSIGKSFSQNTTISVAANMREALKEMSDIATDEVTVLLNSPVIIVPEEQLKDEDPAALYSLSITPTDEEIVIVQQPVELASQVGGDAGLIALFAVSKDLNTVIEDHFKKYEFSHVAINELKPLAISHQPSASKLASNLSSRQSRELSVFFFDNAMYAYAFKQGRLNFFNRYEATNAQDCAYMILGIWKQLGYNQLKDELHLSGKILFMDDLKEILGEFIKKIN